MKQEENNITNIDINQFKIGVEIKEEGKVLARVICTYKKLILKGYRVIRLDKPTEDGSKYWITPPCVYAYGKWRPQVVIDDEGIWKQLQKRIVEEYEKVTKEYYKNKFQIENKETEEESIPF